MKKMANRAFFLCLLNWQGIFLTNKQMKLFAKQILKLKIEGKGGWFKGSIKFAKIRGVEPDVEIGYYHSRLIFRFKIRLIPKTMLLARQLRANLQRAVDGFINSKITNENMDKIGIPMPKFFIYPIFQIKRDEEFWKIESDVTYSLPTTCFYADFVDPWGRFWLLNVLLPKTVHMRISGAKIIASEMSKHFFWHLVNIVFHEGLYRQSRLKDDALNRFFRTEEIKTGILYGLENRLEDFADRLTTVFHERVASELSSRNAFVVLILTIVATVIALAQIFSALPSFAEQIKRFLEQFLVCP